MNRARIAIVLISSCIAAACLLSSCAEAPKNSSQGETPPPTAFDGSYVGISNTVSGGSCPARGVTVPATLTIKNGVAHLNAWKDGTVSSRGGFSLSSPDRGRIEGKIDEQGNIRGTNAGDSCFAVTIWRKSVESAPRVTPPK